jgi:chemotaxis protein CheZ
MNDMQSKLGRTLLTSMVATREQKGELALEDVGAIFMNMAASLSPSAGPVDNFVHQEIARLAKYITDAKQEIFSIQTNEKAEDAILDASQHLDEVIKATEQATNTIMDAADAVQTAANGVGGDKEQQIMDATTRIYDACTFQDITGQRITKVIRLLANIEERIGKLNGLFGSEGDSSASAGVNAGVKNGEITLPKDDKDLLNGPQLSGQGTSQADIDKLLGF